MRRTQSLRLGPSRFKTIFRLKATGTSPPTAWTLLPPTFLASDPSHHPDGHVTLPATMTDSGRYRVPTSTKSPSVRNQPTPRHQQRPIAAQKGAGPDADQGKERRIPTRAGPAPS